MLISFIVTAGVAASVFVQTSNSIQTQSIKTASQTTKEIASGLSVYQIIGQKGDYGLHYLGIVVKTLPGSQPIDLNNTFILISEGTQKALLHYGGYNNPDIFKNPARGEYFYEVLDSIRECTNKSFGIGVLQDSDNSITQTNPVLNRGDKAILYIVCDEHIGHMLYTGANGQDGPLYGTSFLFFESSDNLAFYDEEVNDNDDYDNTEDIFIDYHDGKTYSSTPDNHIAGTFPTDGVLYSNLNSSDANWSIDAYDNGDGVWGSSDFLGIDLDNDDAYTSNGPDVLVAGTDIYIVASKVIQGQHSDWKDDTDFPNEIGKGIDSYDNANGGGWDSSEDFLGQDLDSDHAYTSGPDEIVIGITPNRGADLISGQDPNWTIDAYDKNPGDQWDTTNDLLAYDNDSDGVYTNAADSLIDADGSATNGPGTTSLSSGESLYDIESNDFIVANNLISPSVVWQDRDNDSYYTAQADTVIHGAAPGVRTELVSINPFTAAPIISFIDGGTNNLWESANDLIIQDDDEDGVYTSSADIFVDSDGIGTTGTGSQDISTDGTQLFPFSSSDNVYWFDNDSSSDWSSGDGLWISGGVENNSYNSSEGDNVIILGDLIDESSIGVELDNSASVRGFVHASGAGYTTGKDIFYENVAGELTYSAHEDSIIAGSGATPIKGTTLSTINPFSSSPQIAFYDTGNNLYNNSEDAIILDYHNGGTFSNAIDTTVLGLPSDGEMGSNVATTAGWVKENNNIWTPGEDIFIESTIEMFTYSAQPDISIVGTNPSAGTMYTTLNSFPADWTQLKSYDAADGGEWKETEDAIVIDIHGDLNQNKFSSSADNSIAGKIPADGTLYTSDNSFDNEWLNLLSYNHVDNNSREWFPTTDAIILDTYGNLSKHKYSTESDTYVAGARPPDGTPYTFINGFVSSWGLDSFDKIDGDYWDPNNDFIGEDSDIDRFVTRKADFLIDGDGNFSNGTGRSEGSVFGGLSAGNRLTDLETIYGSGSGLYFYDNDDDGTYDIDEDIILDTSFNKAENHQLNVTGYCFRHELQEKTDIFGRIIPEVGSPGIISFTTPKTYTDGVYKLQ